jgi:molecular chaperone DnaJ
MTISFDDAIRGLQTKIKVNRLLPCSQCGGGGYISSAGQQVCLIVVARASLTCRRGFYEIRYYLPDLPWNRPVEEARSARAATGRAGAWLRNYNCPIPRGVDSGSKVRVPRKAMPE